MADWRVVLASGEVLPVVCSRDERGWWRARCGRRETDAHASPQLAVWALVRGHLGEGFDVREILAPGETTRAELLAEIGRQRDERAAIIEELGADDGDWLEAVNKLRDAIDRATSARTRRAEAEVARLRDELDEALAAAK